MLIIRDVSPCLCPCPCGLVLEKSLFYQFSFKGSVSAENSFNHLRCLHRCLELNGFAPKSAIVPISPITQFRFWKCNLLITCWAEHTGILWCRLFSDLTFHIMSLRTLWTKILVVKEIRTRIITVELIRTRIIISKNRTPTK